MGNKIKKIKNSFLLKFLLVILGIFLILPIYEIIRISFNNSIIFPNLTKIFSTLFDLLKDSNTYLQIGITIGRTLLALLISFFFAYILGAISGLFNNVSYILKPFISLLKCIPVPCFIFILLVIFFDRSLLPILIVVFMVSFPIIYESTKGGIENIDDNIMLSLKLEGRYKPNSIFKVILPLGLPYVFISFLSSFGLSIKVEITAEILFNPQYTRGIGEIVYSAYYNANYQKLYASIILIAFIFLIIDGLIYFLKQILKKFEF